MYGERYVWPIPEETDEPLPRSQLMKEVRYTRYINVTNGCEIVTDKRIAVKLVDLVIK